MKAVVPQKADALFSLSEKQCATEALVQMFLQNEENARNEESKTGEKHLHFPNIIHKSKKT
jgi:hypothetical protein